MAGTLSINPEILERVRWPVGHQPSKAKRESRAWTALYRVEGDGTRMPEPYTTVVIQCETNSNTSATETYNRYRHIEIIAFRKGTPDSRRVDHMITGGAN